MSQIFHNHVIYQYKFDLKKLSKTQKLYAVFINVIKANIYLLVRNHGYIFCQISFFVFATELWLATWRPSSYQSRMMIQRHFIARCRLGEQKLNQEKLTEHRLKRRIKLVVDEKVR